MPETLGALPRIVPPGGAPVASEAPVLAGPPVTAGVVPAWTPEAPEGPVLLLAIAEGTEILEATGGLAGASNTANLASAATLDGGQALIDLGDPRPLTRIAFTKADGTQDSRLMIQLGGSWIEPQSAGGVDFASYAGDPFPELVTAKALLTNAAAVTDVESVTHPSNVTLRATDGGVPFFFHRGALRPAGARVPDFAQPLALALRSCEPAGGVCALDLVARSETFGTVTMPSAAIVSRAAHNSLDGLSFEERTRTLLPGAEPPATFDLPMPPGLTPPADRPAVAAVELGLIVLGLGPAFAATDGRRGAVVSERFQVAQPVPCADALTVAAVHLYLLSRTAPATLTVELREDAGGEPRGAVLASASPPAGDLPESAFQWLRVGFDGPVTVAAGSRLWIVLEAAEGEVEWRGDDVPAEAAAALFSTDLGNAWEPHRLAASFILETSPTGLEAPPGITISAGGETQAVVYDPRALPILFDGDSPLARGINQALADAAPGAPIPLALASDAPLPVQITLTRFDVTYTQVLTVAPA